MFTERQNRGARESDKGGSDSTKDNREERWVTGGDGVTGSIFPPFPPLSQKVTDMQTHTNTQMMASSCQSQYREWWNQEGKWWAWKQKQPPHYVYKKNNRRWKKRPVFILLFFSETRDIFLLDGDNFGCQCSKNIPFLKQPQLSKRNSVMNYILQVLLISLQINKVSGSTVTTLIAGNKWLPGRSEINLKTSALLQRMVNSYVKIVMCTYLS